MPSGFERALADVQAQVVQMGCAAQVDADGGTMVRVDLSRPTASGYDVAAKLTLSTSGDEGVRLAMTFRPRQQRFHWLNVHTDSKGGDAFVTQGGNGFESVFVGQHRGPLVELCRINGALLVEKGRARIDAVLPDRSPLRRTVAALIQLWRALRPNGHPLQNEVPPLRRDPPPVVKARRRVRRDTPAAEEADRLLAWVDDATTPWSSTCERVRETVEARVKLELHAGAPLTGRVVIAFASVGRTLDKLGLRATLEVPRHDGKLKLTPQQGFAGFLSRWGEDVVNDEAIDDAYVIQLNGHSKHGLLAHRQELLAMAPSGMTLQQAHEHLVIQLDHLGTDREEVQLAIGAALKLWERWAEQLMGA